jgi:hypothetical protein
MIGSSDEVEEIILALNEREANIDYDAGIYRRRYSLSKDIKNIPAGSQQRCPMVDDQVTQVLSISGGIRLIVGLKVLGLDSIPDALESICGPGGKWGDLSGLQFETIRSGENALRRSLEKKMENPRVLFIKPSKNEAERFIKFCERNSLVMAGHIIPVFLLDAQNRENRDLALRRGAVSLSPWGHQMLRAYLEEAELLSLDSREYRNAILNVTGGAPKALMQLSMELGKKGNNLTLEDINIISTSMAELYFELEPELYKLLSLMMETDNLVDYCVLREIISVETSEELGASLQVLEMVGMIEMHDPSYGVIRLSRMAKIAKNNF